MASPVSWLSTDVLHALGWALVHSLWQGVAVAALAAIAMGCCRRAPVRRRGNRIGYEYNDAYIYFTVDEKGPPAKVERFSIRASHFVFIK